MQQKYFSGTFVLSAIFAKFANIDYCIAEQMGNFFMVFSRISLLLVLEPNVSIVRITVCMILDNDGIPTF